MFSSNNNINLDPNLVEATTAGDSRLPDFLGEAGKGRETMRRRQRRLESGTGVTNPLEATREATLDSNARGGEIATKENELL